MSTTTQTFSNKSNAKRKAKSLNLNLDYLQFHQNDEGRWYWVDSVEQDLIEQYGEAYCPHCNVHLSNGVIADGDTDGSGHDKVIRLTHEFECMACGKGFGKEIKRTKRTAKSGTNEGIKIQKNREERNGVKRPSEGGKCAQLWSLFDAMYGEKGIVPTPKPAKERSAELGLDPVTTTVQLYRWREFMGFKGK